MSKSSKRYAWCIEKCVHLESNTGGTGFYSYISEITIFNEVETIDGKSPENKDYTHCVWFINLKYGQWCGAPLIKFAKSLDDAKGILLDLIHDRMGDEYLKDGLS